MEKKVIEQIHQTGMIAILRGISPQEIVPTACALLEGGISLMEIAFNHKDKAGIADTLRSIERVCDTLGDQVCVGAGTVLTPEQVDEAHKAGAGYIISPNVDERVIARTKEQRLASLPGALTPTEVVSAVAAGCDIVKLFPAGVWGADYVKAVRGPLAHIPMIAVGGVGLENLGSFISAGVCGVGIGGDLVNAQAIHRRDYGSVTHIAGRFVRALDTARKQRNSQ